MKHLNETILTISNPLWYIYLNGANDKPRYIEKCKISNLRPLKRAAHFTEKRQLNED